MQPFGVLDRYIGKTIFTTIMMTLFMLVSLSGIIKFVDQLKKAGQGNKLSYVGVRASDLTMSFLFCKAEKHRNIPRILPSVS